MPKRKQCAKCPWKVSTDPEQIPNGYCPAKHRELESTIAEPATLNTGGLHIMACHETDVGQEQACVGWLNNQLGVGNNLGLRMFVRGKPELYDFELDGEQHERFEDTLGEREYE